MSLKILGYKKAPEATEGRVNAAQNNQAQDQEELASIAAPAVDIDLLKTSLGIDANDTEWDEYLSHIIQKATSYVETYTQRTIMLAKLEYKHHNKVIYLPKPRIHKIIEVKSGNKVLEKDKDYKTYHSVDTMVVMLDKKYENNENTVTYWAGYGDKPENVPATLRNIIFDCARTLFEQGQHTDAETSTRFVKQVKEMVKGSDVNDRGYIGTTIGIRPE